MKRRGADRKRLAAIHKGDGEGGEGIVGSPTSSTDKMCRAYLGTVGRWPHIFTIFTANGEKGGNEAPFSVSTPIPPKNGEATSKHRISSPILGTPRYMGKTIPAAVLDLSVFLPTKLESEILRC